VVQYYDSWPFHHDSRIPRGSKSHRRADTFRTLGPVNQRLARANGYAKYQRHNGGDWSAFVVIAEQLTDDGWQPLDVARAARKRLPGTRSRQPPAPATRVTSGHRRPPPARPCRKPAARSET
jgi:hypothetical protein